jgi:hypothetical protein
MPGKAMRICGIRKKEATRQSTSSMKYRSGYHSNPKCFRNPEEQIGVGSRLGTLSLIGGGYSTGVEHDSVINCSVQQAARSGGYQIARCNQEKAGRSRKEGNSPNLERFGLWPSSLLSGS